MGESLGELESLCAAWFIHKDFLVLPNSLECASGYVNTASILFYFIRYTTKIVLAMFTSPDANITGNQSERALYNVYQSECALFYNRHIKTTSGVLIIKF